MNIADAKLALPLPALLIRLGLQSPDKDRFKMPCPIHNEQKGESFSAQRKNGEWVWHCFGKCARGGDEITLLEAYKSVTRDDAITLYLEMAGNGAVSKARSAPVTPTQSFDWQKCFTPLTPADRIRIGNDRWYSRALVEWLHTNKLMGAYNGHVAFPVRDNGQVVAAHYKVDGGWR